MSSRVFFCQRIQNDSVNWWMDCLYSLIGVAAAANEYRLQVNIDQFGCDPVREPRMFGPSKSPYFPSPQPMRIIKIRRIGQVFDARPNDRQAAALN
jgi:hypothetical protein